MADMYTIYIFLLENPVFTHTSDTLVKWLCNVFFKKCIITNQPTNI